MKKQTESIVTHNQGVQVEEDDLFGTDISDEDDRKIKEIEYVGLLPEKPQLSPYQLWLQKVGVVLITSGLMCADYFADCWQLISSPCRKKKRAKTGKSNMGN